MRRLTPLYWLLEMLSKHTRHTITHFLIIIMLDILVLFYFSYVPIVFMLQLQPEKITIKDNI